MLWIGNDENWQLFFYKETYEQKLENHRKRTVHLLDHCLNTKDHEKLCKCTKFHAFFSHFERFIQESIRLLSLLHQVRS